MRRWERGRRYVRLVRYARGEDTPYGVRYGLLSRVDSDAVHIEAAESLCLLRAQELMAVGGSP